MTVAEFLDWDPEDGSGAIWQLRDGEPEMMAPASLPHGAVQGELHRMIENHLVAAGSHCRSVIAPGVVPRLRSEHNMLVPDVGVTCAPVAGHRSLPDPVLLIEVMSPGDEAKARANVWPCTTIPSLAEVLIVSSTGIAAEMLRRQPDRTWPERPELLGPDDELRLDSIGFAAPLRAACRTSGLP